LDQDVYEAAKTLADASGGNLGVVISALARKGLKARESFPTKSGLSVFQVPDDARVIPGDRSADLAAEDDR
jgi:hypothetical protein